MRNPLSIILGLSTLVIIVLLSVVVINIGFVLISSVIGVFIGIVLLSLIIFFVLFGGAIFWLWMFIDCLKRENFSKSNDKAVWVVVLLLASMIGAILYYFLAKRKLNNTEHKIRKNKTKR